MRAGALVTIAALGTQLGSAQLSFLRRDVSLSAHSAYGSSGLPWHLATGDFNGDGRLDLPSGGSWKLDGYWKFETTQAFLAMLGCSMSSKHSSTQRAWCFGIRHGRAAGNWRKL
jgi:hypothetical protein